MNLPARRTEELPRLLLVTDRTRTRGRELTRQVALAVDGGVRFVQIREPDLPTDELERLVRSLQGVLPADVLLAVHGDREVARRTGVGLHEDGVESEAAEGAESRPWPYGRSAHDGEGVRLAVRGGADFVILGGSSGPDTDPGDRDSPVDRLREARAAIGSVPLYAIGSVSVSRIPELIHAGAHGVAVCGELISANHPRRIAQAMTLAIGVASRSPG